MHVEFFQSRPFLPGYKQHNAALKWYRGVCEGEGVPEHFCKQDGDTIPLIVHPPGMDYTWSEDETTHWCWLDMLSLLDADSLQYVVNGPENRSGGVGVVRCMVVARPNSYDHKRHVALRAAGNPLNDRKLQVWDFVLIRADGTGIRLHPQWSTTKIDTYPIQGYLEPVEPPSRGLGRSDGRGTYHWYKEVVGNSKTLRFDAKKKSPAYRARGNSASSASGSQDAPHAA